MINKERLLRDNRLCKAIIGLSVEELKNLAAEFSACYLIYRKKNRKDHERQMGAGQKGFIARRLNFDYSICIKNRSSIVHPVSIFLRLA
ncbi:hypothetical protein [Candidatus Arsenophonus triatominarum]|uniref:hypothetical protein n=1 Tax=Candidatus Arsenophonus triatominarum TaxID=57911 RepID=UPI0013968099|nr:hypothetical protein [Candidatus Arsenophonus triatominarum]